MFKKLGALQWVSGTRGLQWVSETRCFTVGFRNKGHCSWFKKLGALQYVSESRDCAMGLRNYALCNRSPHFTFYENVTRSHLPGGGHRGTRLEVASDCKGAATAALGRPRTEAFTACEPQHNHTNSLFTALYCLTLTSKGRKEFNRKL